MLFARLTGRFRKRSTSRSAGWDSFDTATVIMTCRARQPGRTRFWSALKTAADDRRPHWTDLGRETRRDQRVPDGPMIASAAPSARLMGEHHETTCLGFHCNYRLSGEYSLIETPIRSERAQ
jgi:hypothetical protein